MEKLICLINNKSLLGSGLTAHGWSREAQLSEGVESGDRRSPDAGREQEPGSHSDLPEDGAEVSQCPPRGSKWARPGRGHLSFPLSPQSGFRVRECLC